jgi:hypothetical protein
MGKKKKREDSTKNKIKDFWACERCDIDSRTKGRMIPCPRGSCEAEIIGRVEVITVTKFFKNQN